METLVTSLRLPVDLVNAYEDLARKTDRTRSYLMVEALREYLGWRQERIAAVEKGIAQIERGDFSTQEEVEAESEAWMLAQGMTREQIDALRREVDEEMDSYFRAAGEQARRQAACE